MESNMTNEAAPVPVALAMLCRAILRDPIVMQAHLRPRRQAPAQADGGELK
jgi:hypothetical protein